MLPGTPERATHDDERHGTMSLYAALDITTGKVIGSLHNRHRAIEFKKFLQTIDREVPDELDVHLVIDNASSHKTPAIKKWLAAHPRFVVHFTPTSSSWMNLVERWFGELTAKKLKRGAHRSTPALSADTASGSTPGTRTPSRSSGPRPPTRSSNPSPATAHESTNHDTSPLRAGPGSRAAGRRHAAEADAACPRRRVDHG